ncbi:hypothetical protein QBC46DRAFT_229862, partial [Diplogelasinospora grovesii]
LKLLIKVKGEDEIIIIFYNRIGTKEEVTYTRTNVIISIKGGKVFVYKVLSHKVKNVLVVNINAPFINKLA